MTEIPIPYRFEEREYQKPFLKAVFGGQYDRLYKTWHRRCGKDKVDWNVLVRRAVEIPAQHFYLLPTYAQAKKVIWEGIDNNGMRFLDHVPARIMDGKPNDTEMKIRLKNGSLIQLIGTDNYDSIRGTNPKTCVFSEFPFQDPRAWGVVSPILKLNKGMAIFNGTPNGENHAKALWDMAVTNPSWWTQCLTVDDTKLLTPEDIERERAEGMSEEMIQQEYYCSWSSGLVGAYYAQRIREMEQGETKRIGVVPWTEYEPVYSFWDLGMNDTMSIICVQQDGYAWKIIDCYSNHGLGWEPYVKFLKDNPYHYGIHYVPHDAKNREFGTGGKERSKTLDALLREPVEVLKRPTSVQDKIEAVRWILPKCFIDAEKCRDLINALKNYRQDYDEVLKTWKNEPKHDWSSHFADAFAYFALAVRNGTFLNTQANSGTISGDSSPNGAMELII